jgi:asparagine synthase (glutamine-hydrolysing)
MPLTALDFKPARTDKLVVGSTITDIMRKDVFRMKFSNASILLSGGVDSVLTLAMIRSLRPEVKLSCISMGFGEDDDEISASKEIARELDCDFYPLVKANILAELPKLVSISKEPRWNLYQFYALELARSKSDLIFSGDGGDELFGGYTFRYRKYLSRFRRASGWKQLTRLYLSCHERDWVPDQHKIFGPKMRFSWDRIYGLIGRYFQNSLNPLDQVFLADINGKLMYDWMPGNIAFEKFLNAKIASLFLSERMVAFATHLPWQLKYDPRTGVGKLPLRLILRRQIRQIEPAKKGFSVNTISLWKRDKEIICQYVNNESQVVKAGIISNAWLDSARTKLDSLNVRYINKMLGLLALEVWWRLNVGRTMKKTARL